MANFFDQFDDAPAPAAVVAQPQAAPAANFFDQFDAPAQAAPTASALTVHGSPQSAGDALDMVEGTGTAAYDTGAPENGATIGDRARNLGGMAVAALDGAANSIPFTDRAAALAATVTGLGGKFGDYSGNLAQLRGEEGAAMAAHPGAALTGELVGGAALPVGAVGDVARAATLGGKVLTGAKAGALIGGLSGASASQDLGDLRQTAASTGLGAGIGTLAGAAAPAIGAGAGAAYRSLMAPSVVEAAGVPASARQMIADAIRRDGPDAVMAKLRQFGPDATLSDLGPSLQGIAMGQAVKDGPGVPVILGNLEARQRGTSDRILGDVGQALGPAQNADAYGRSIAEVGQASTDPLLARAAQAGVPYPAELAQRPAVASALRDVAKDAANRGTPLPTVTLDEAGNPVASDAAIQAYEAGQRPAMTGALANMLGADPAVGPLATQSALTIQRKAASDPLYEAYRQMSVPMTSDLADVLNRPSTRAAIAQAERKAQDEGESIFAPRARRFEDDPLGSGNTPEPPIDLDNIPPFQAEQAPSRPPPVGTSRPPDLHEFIRSLGGVRDPGGDLAAMGHDNLIAPAGRGLSPDQMRQAAAQAGYLGPNIDDATANTTINDLFGAIGSDNPIHSVFDQDAAAAWAARDAAMSEFNRGGVPRGEVGRDAGPRPMAPGMPFGGPDAPTGPAIRAPQITPKGLDLVKRALQDKADIARRNGSNDDARIFGNLKDELLGAIENHPDPSIADAYGAARQAYAGPSREIDALNAGRAAFGDNVTAEQVQREYAALATDGERQRYRQGMFAAGSQKLSKAGDTSNFVRTVAGNQALRDKFAAVVPHPEALDTFNGHVSRAQQQFTEAQRPTPEAWQQALQALDARAAKGEPGIAAARDALAAHMGQNPDFARARGMQQDYAGLQDAITAGRTALRGGPTGVHPEDYAAAFSGLSPAGQAAQRIGLADNVYRKLGDTRNDLTAINDVIKGPNDRSRAIIGTTFGQDAADRLAGAASREGAFAKNYDDILRGSMTARRNAMEKAQADPVHRPFEIGATRDLTAAGLAATLGKQPINAILRALQPRVDNSARDLALAKVLTVTGDERNRLLAQVLRAQNAANASAAIGAPAERLGTTVGAISPSVLAAALRGRQQSGR